MIKHFDENAKVGEDCNMSRPQRAYCVLEASDTQCEPSTKSLLWALLHDACLVQKGNEQLQTERAWPTSMRNWTSHQQTSTNRAHFPFLVLRWAELCGPLVQKTQPDLRHEKTNATDVIYNSHLHSSLMPRTWQRREQTPSGRNTHTWQVTTMLLLVCNSSSKGDIGIMRDERRMTALK